MPRIIEQNEADIAATQGDIAAIKVANPNWASNETYASLASTHPALLKEKILLTQSSQSPQASMY